MATIENRTAKATAVRVDQLTRKFKTRQEEIVALDAVSLEIPAGEIHGLLGPNGAGKTTLIKVLSTILLPTSGSAHVCGHDVVHATDAVRRMIGIVFGGERGLYTRLSARQNLEYWGALYRLPSSEARSRTKELLDRMGLTDRADQRVEQYSRGMKQRLHLARGLMGNASVLLLDEPTTGMDPLAAIEFRELVREFKHEGRTVLLSTHDMREAEAICDRVTLIDRGRILATESPRAIGTLISRFARVDVDVVDDDLLDRIGNMAGVISISRLTNGRARIEVGEASTTPDVLRLLVDSGVTEVCTSLPNLEDVYVQLLGERGLRV